MWRYVSAVSAGNPPRFVDYKALDEPIGSTVQRSSGFRELVMSQDDDFYVVTGESKGFLRCGAYHPKSQRPLGAFTTLLSSSDSSTSNLAADYSSGVETSDVDDVRNG